MHEIELQAAYTVISNSGNSVQANQAGTSAAKNPVPSQVSKPGRQKTGHRIEDERLYKALKKAVTEDQVERADWQEKKWGQFKASRSYVSLTVSRLKQNVSLFLTLIVYNINYSLGFDISNYYLMVFNDYNYY